ncbi:MAG: efflux RND transporter periplasmic adaptor subunit [Gammaproteobacteria bacterium]|nr:efflux RND transporter periplasmic adaptor subunit [Gammaproteobacteria bacterium]
MDRKITKPKFNYKKLLPLSLVIAIIAIAVYVYPSINSSTTFAVENQRLTVSTVQPGVFEDFIPVRTRVVPLKTVYLDAIEGGRVEKILIEDGAIVSKGQPIVQLSNTQLQLNVMRNEAAVTEQLNNMRNTELSLEQNRLSHKRNIIDLNYQIKHLTRRLEREKTIFSNGSIATSQIDETRDLLEYNQQKLSLTLESQKTDAMMQEQQLTFLKETGYRLEQSLQFARENMENLNMKAPVAGKLSGFDIEVGQSINRGERIGQIDDPTSFKLEANIDEYYLERIDIGQKATITHNQKDYYLTINKVYPDVKNGQFRVDFTFGEHQPGGIRRGQTLQAKLTLGDDSNVLLIPNGAFYQDTGGHWIFVVSEDGTKAFKRSIKLGRKNNRYIEVIEGLDSNEKIITSPYSSFKEMDSLNLTQ